MQFGIEIVGALVATVLGSFFPILKSLAKGYLENTIKKGKNGEIQKLIAELFNLEISETQTYKQRLEETLHVLKNAFNEVDKAAVEFTDLMKEKEKNISLLERRLMELSNEEANLKNKVEVLQKVPLEALTHFEAILNKGDKRSAVRDYLLFISGIIVSVIVTLILKFYFNIQNLKKFKYSIDNNDINEYINGVMQRVDHHGQNVNEVLLTLAGSVMW